MTAGDFLNVSSNPTELPVPCLYCGEEIVANARLCKTCGSFQRPWRTEFKYWSGIVGLITLVVSGATISLEFGVRLHDRLFGADLAVGSYETSNIARVWNTAAVDVWITNVRFDSTGPTYSLSEPANVVIQPSKVGTIDLRSLFRRGFQGTVGDLLARSGDYATGLTDVQRRSISEDLVPEKNTVAPDFMLKDGPEHRHLLEIHGDDLFTYACIFELSYRRVDEQEDRSISVPCIGTVREVAP